jgi:hypothetical protein
MSTNLKSKTLQKYNDYDYLLVRQSSYKLLSCLFFCIYIYTRTHSKDSIHKKLPLQQISNLSYASDEATA